MSVFPSPSQLLARLACEGAHPSRRLGQRFLVDEAILERIAAATEADASTLVVEIGAGPATLTTLLCRRAGGVVAIERDSRLKRFHESVFTGHARIELIYADALRIDLCELARRRRDEWKLKRTVLAGNLPFQITSPLLFAQTGPGLPWERMVLMVQREVADRVVSPPGSRVYGVLSVKVAYWWRAVGRFEVAAEKFRPRPRVDASVLVLEPTERDEQPDPEEWPALSRFVDLCFNQRRKKLYNSPAAGKGSSAREKFIAALRRTGADPDSRAERLSPEQFLTLFRVLREP